MAGTNYDVVVNYSSTGDLSGGLEKGLAKSKSKMNDFIGDFAGSFNSAFDSIASNLVSKLADAGKAAAVAMGAAMGVAIKEGFKFNQESEDSQVAVASIFNQNGIGKGFNEGMNLAGRTMMQMRKDAQELPGEFSDLQNIMTRVASAGASVGLGAWGTEHLASRTMMAAAMTGMKGHGQMDLAGREMSAILEGRATDKMPFFKHLMGADAHAASFNKLSANDRMKQVGQHLDKLEEGKGAVMGTWSTLSSNFMDKLHQGAGAVTYGLFDKAKMTVDRTLNRPDAAMQKKYGMTDAEVSAGKAKYDARATKLVEAGMKASEWLVKAFDDGIAFFNKWGPAALTFVETIEGGLKKTFGWIDDKAGGISDRLFKFLNDPTAFDKIGHGITTAIALRAGTGVLSAAPGMANMAAMLGGGGSAGLAAVAAPAAIAVGVLAVGAAGLTSALLDSDSAFHDIATTVGGDFMSRVKDLGASFVELWDHTKPLAEALGVTLLGVAEALVIAFQGVMYAVNGLGLALHNLGGWISGSMSSGVQRAGGALEGDVMGDLGSELSNDQLALETFRNSVSGATDAIDDLNNRAKGRVIDPNDANIFIKAMTASAEPEKEIKPPKVHQTIHKVEIKVEGNEDPDRVADLTLKKLQDLASNPKTSPDDIRTAPWRGRGQ